MASRPTIPGGARILVTGASGFVGTRLMTRLAQTVDAGSLLGLGGPDRIGGLEAVDLTVAGDTRRVFQAFQPTIVVHLAAQSSVATGNADPHGVWLANFDATRAVATASMELNHAVRLVFASSGEVYGGHFNAGPCAEDGPIQPLSTYARSKAACELLLADMAGPALQVVALRLFNHTGPGQDSRFVVPSFAAQIADLQASDEQVIQVGNLDACRDFTDVDDIIEAYMAVIADAGSGPDYAVFNVGSGKPRSIRSILDTLIRAHGSEVRAVLDPARQRPSEIPVAAGVFDRFQQTYSWTPTRSFDDTVAAVLAHERALRSRPV